jgi:hypothetical protein
MENKFCYNPYVELHQMGKIGYEPSKDLQLVKTKIDFC